MPSFLNSLFSGAFAGIMVDTVLYPIDTIKTRLQAKEGFIKSGGFTGLYKGMSSAALGAVPGAALFFVGYDYSRNFLSNSNSMGLFQNANSTGLNLQGEILASCIGEIAACLVRCPTENVKQNAQVSKNTSTFQIFKNILKERGGVSGLYRGYFTLVCREVPFSMIQMPLWQSLKRENSILHNTVNSNLVPGIAGSISGSIAAFLTTPIDVAKTRQMLDSGKSKDMKYQKGLAQYLREIYRIEGVSGLFKGAATRITWIALGGFIFLGGYDLASKNMNF